MDINKEQIELKHFLSDINDLRIHESNNNISEWGKDKLKEYEFILTELEELKKLRLNIKVERV
jgi:hypothetical protein